MIRVVTDEREPYRLYLLNTGGHIFKADWVQADGDEEAKAKVEAMGLSFDAELRFLSRKVGIIRAASYPSLTPWPDRQLARG
jgi:hypothetical protein